MEVGSDFALRGNPVHVNVERVTRQLYNLRWPYTCFLLQFTKCRSHKRAVQIRFAMAAGLEPAPEVPVPQKQRVLQALVDENC